MLVVENCRTQELTASCVRAMSSREVPPADLNRVYIVFGGVPGCNWPADVWLLEVVSS